MARVFVTSTAPRAGDGYHRLLASAEGGAFGDHTLAADPESADLILFVENWEADWLLTDVRRHAVLKRYRSKSFVICETDEASHLLPGVYANVHHRELLAGRVRTGPYLWMYHNEFADFAPFPEDPDYLFSFVGSFKTAPVRRRLAGLQHLRAYVRDTSDESPRVWWHSGPAEKRAFQRAYAEVGKRSAFILCPRGHSPSTVRLFEAMRMGRVPVVVSDAWVPPDGPDWEGCSIRIAERDLHLVPSLLEEREHEAAALGAAARRTWEAWFSPDVCFHRTVEWCLDIQRSRRLPEWFAYPLKHLSLLGPQHVKSSTKTALRLAGAWPSPPSS
jgi:hypothetical protein